MTETTVSLDSFLKRELPVKLPGLKRKHIVRVRGLVDCVEVRDNAHLLWLADVKKPFCFTGRLAIPPVGVNVEIIATEGAAWMFAKWWTEIEESGYSVHAPDVLKQLILDALASSPDERITADDLHSIQIMELLKTLRRDPRTLGAALAGLCTEGIIRPTGERVRSRRRECHFRPDLKVWTWGEAAE